ncbi:MAG: type VI secretion system baseplate subunit TssG [Polyangiaceae bacterium]|nr:type VI secretion system baseplate subunit TssG [Polyangiaceae bacterium]
MSWIERLAERPESFDFHVALRRFEVEGGDGPRLGEAERPSDEPIRLGQNPSAAFAGSELTTFSPGEATGRARLAVGFFGLWGPHGPLPGHLTEYARERQQHHGDPTLLRFADVFHHRMMLLFYRAWARTEPAVAFDRPDSDAFALYVGALMGLGLEATRHRGGTSDFSKLHHAPAFASGSRHPDGLRSILADHFGLPAAIDEFVGEWLDIPDDARWRLGTDPATGRLGHAAVGRRVFSRSRFRIVLGPLTGADFERMLPGSPAVDALASIVRLYTNDEWGWELRLVLSPFATAPLRLGGGARLGWTTRVGCGAPVAVDLLFDPATHLTRRITKPSLPSSALQH